MPTKSNKLNKARSTGSTVSNNLRPARTTEILAEEAPADNTAFQRRKYELEERLTTLESASATLYARLAPLLPPNEVAAFVDVDTVKEGPSTSVERQHQNVLDRIMFVINGLDWLSNNADI